jgi:hypothetical protein
MAVNGIPPLSPADEAAMHAEIARLSAVVKANWVAQGEPETLAEKSAQVFALVAQHLPPGFPDRVDK